MPEADPMHRGFTLMNPSLHGYACAAAVKTLQTSLPIAVVLLVLPEGAGRTMAELVLRGPLRRALAVAFPSTLPMFVAFAGAARLRWTE